MGINLIGWDGMGRLKVSPVKHLDGDDAVAVVAATAEHQHGASHGSGRGPVSHRLEAADLSIESARYSEVQIYCLSGTVLG